MKKRAFLAPIALSVAALLGANGAKDVAHPWMKTTIGATQDGSPLVLAPATDTSQMLASHASHASHSSHSSHHSHSSHSSGSGHSSHASHSSHSSHSSGDYIA